MRQGRVRRQALFGQKKSRIIWIRLGRKIWRQPTLAESIKPLPSARLCLTAVFGMGTGRTTALWPPIKLFLSVVPGPSSVELALLFGYGFQFCLTDKALFSENYTQVGLESSRADLQFILSLKLLSFLENRCLVFNVATTRKIKRSSLTSD